MDNRSVVVTNGKTERTIAAEAWALLKSSKEKGSTRKGWTFLRYEDPKVKTSAKAAGSAPAAPSYLPPEIAAAATVAAAEATMLAGETVTPEQVMAAQGLTQPDAPPAGASAPEQAASEPLAPAKAAEAPAAPAADAKAEGQGKADDLASIKNMGPKTVQVLNAIGIHTYAQLRDADEGALTTALETNGLGVKKALIPHWKKEAANLVQMPS